MLNSTALETTASPQILRPVEQERSWRRLIPRTGPGWWRWFVTLLVVMGPGIIVMQADNDAGGITTYAVSGARYGFNLIWLMILLFPVAYVVQEMTVRLGAVTKRGHAELIFHRFGKFWGYFSLGDLFLGNTLTLTTEFIGMAAALGIFGVPIWLSLVLSVVMTGGIVLTGKYWTWERIALVFALVNLIYIPAAFMVHPNTSAILSSIISPKLAGGFSASYLFMLMANIGTTIAPWMLFFQQSAVVDKRLQIKDIPFGRIDTFIGAMGTQVVSIAIMIVMGSTLFAHNIPINDAAEAAQGLVPFLGQTGETLFAIGLFDAGFLGAICLSLSTSWAFGEVFGWAHTLNRKIKEAPWFYALYFFGIVVAAVVVMLPHIPLIVITTSVQVLATLFLAPALTFLVLLLNDKKLMGTYVNKPWQNIYTWIIVAAILIMSTVYGLTAIFPNLLPA